MEGVTSTDGTPIEGAVLEIWQTAENGLYSGQDDSQPEFNFYGCMKTGADGRYLFSTVRPAPILSRRWTGWRVVARYRQASMAPVTSHFIVTSAEHRTLVTEVFPSDDPYLDEDAVFGVREKLIMEYQERHDPSDLPDELAIKPHIDTPYYVVDFDFVLAPK